MEKIDLAQAKEMVDRYATTRKTLIDKAYGINDTKSTWIPIDELRTYINQLPADATGLRIYLSVHDDTDAVSPHQTTIILIGTVNDGGRNVDAIISDTVLAKDGGPTGLEPFNKNKDCPPICE